VRTPQRALHLRAVLRRTYRGKSAARESTSAERPDTMSSSFRDLARSAGSSPRTAADAIVYAAFSVIGRLGRRRAGNHRWERDDSSRRPPER
jgi:hypothetical protein